MIFLDSERNIVKKMFDINGVNLEWNVIKGYMWFPSTDTASKWSKFEFE